MASTKLSRLAARALAIGVLAAGPFAVAGGQRPTPQQAHEILDTRPDLVAQMRQRLQTSGLTPDQVRARLRAAGYPDTLLDSYMSGSSPSGASEPTDDVYSAVAALGIADTSDVAGLRRMASRKTPAQPTPVDSSNVLPVFGLDIFGRNTTQFDPNLSGPVDANYRLGPGDQLVLVLTGDVESSSTLEVTRQGFIVIPQVGQIDVANLTMGQLESVLYTRLARVYAGIRRTGGTTHFSISPSRLRTNQVYVIGDVAAPGSYRVSAAGTVLTALYAAGGPTTVGSLRRIEVRRGSRVVEVLDLYDYLLRGDASHDPRLENGDVVFIPVHGSRVKVTGEVLRPAIYELKPGETLADAIRSAGGFSASASRRRVQIDRILPPSARAASGAGRDRVVIEVASEQLNELSAATGAKKQPAVPGGGANIPVEDGDSISVFSVTGHVRNRLKVTGNVWAPGQIGLSPGMRVSEALQLSGGVKPDVYLGEVLITRLLSDSTHVQLRTSLRDSTGAVVNDLLLNEDDEVHVFSVSEFRPARYVVVNGAVRKPGRFPYREGMTLRDLMLLAGGLEERAYLREAEIARLPEDRTGGRLAVTTRVPLDSTYLFERGPDGKYLGPPGVSVQQGSAGAAEIVVRPYDNVLILSQPDWELERTVTVDGEVHFPGVYSLRTKGERVRDLIERAGGLTNEGYADGVVFVRHRGGQGRIGIDLPTVLKDGRFRDNFLLENGDSIYVPPYNGAVRVAGAVNSPVSVAYVPGKNLNFYIQAAGGVTPKAEDRRSYVTQPNGKVESRSIRPFFPDGAPVPRPGSSVFVPEKDPSDKKDYTQSILGIAQIVAGLVAIAAVLRK